MNKLILSSYLCAIAATIMWVLLALDIMDSIDSIYDGDVLFVFLLFPPVLQFFYSRKIAGIIDLRPYKSTKSLDDFAINDMELDGKVFSNSVGWKAVLTVNSVLLCLFFLMAIYSAPHILPEIFDHKYNGPSDYALPLLPIVGVLTVPTVFLNLRTFNIQRISNPTDSAHI